MSNLERNSQDPLEVPSEGQVYRDYERALTDDTDIPLQFHGPDMLSVIHHTKKQEHLFCALMSKTNQGCSACYKLQRKLEEETQFEPQTLKCFAGLCETADPLRMGGNLLAFLQTGRLFLQGPDRLHFNQIAIALIEWGVEIDLKRLEETYFNTRVLEPQQYQVLIRLLNTFAEHLASCSRVLICKAKQKGSPAIAPARHFTSEHPEDEMPLASVARVVNLSATYFSERFREVAGINFVEYVARTRVEKARNLLLNPNRQVSEVAFETGFQSLSQFNRTFKKITGQSPREYRSTITPDR